MVKPQLPSDSDVERIMARNSYPSGGQDAGIFTRPNDPLGLWVILLFALFVILMVAVTGPLELKAAVYWVYGPAGYAHGIRAFAQRNVIRFSDGGQTSDFEHFVLTFGGFLLTAVAALMITLGARQLCHKIGRARRESA